VQDQAPGIGVQIRDTIPGDDGAAPEQSPEEDSLPVPLDEQ